MQYFFHLVGDDITLFEDDVGIELRDDLSAKLYAAVTAAEIAQTGNYYSGYEIRAVDKSGKEVARMPVVVPRATHRLAESALALVPQSQRPGA